MAEMAKQKPRMIALYLRCAWNNKPTLHYEGHDVMRKCATLLICDQMKTFRLATWLCETFAISDTCVSLVN